MKKALFLHGTDGNPKELWWPWLNSLLKNNGYEILDPILPQNHTPNRFIYDNFLKTKDWDFNNNLIVGHSSGATTALNLLMSEWFPKVKTVVLVGAFLNQKLVKNADWYEAGQFDNLFPDNFDINKIKSKADSFIFVHGDNDPYCNYDDAKKICNILGGKFITIKNGHHLANTSGITEIPELEKELRFQNLI